VNAPVSTTEREPIPAAVKFVLATMLLNAIGFGLIVPVVPDLIRELGNMSLDRAAAIGGYLSFTFAIFQFICSPIIGNLSDRFGRRPVLLAAVAGYAVDFFMLAFAPTLAWLFVARALSGAFGATNAPGQSVIADLFPPEQRSRYFGLIGAAFGIGFVLGPALGGALGQFGHRVPFLVAGVLAAANFAYGYFFMPETLAPENRRPFEWRRATPGGALRVVRQLPGIVPISLVYLFWQIASLVYPMIWNFYTMGRFGWTSGGVALSLSLVGLVMASTQTMLLPRLVARYGERGTAQIGIVGGTVAFFAYAFADKAWMALALIPLMAIQALVHANLTSMMTRRADATTQGEVQGYAAAIMAIGSIIAPIVFNPLLAWFTAADAPIQFYGAPFIAAGIFGLLSIIILARMPRAKVSDRVLETSKA
jgi:MFS transporter, DHA1 family, tetracycline resistance protein